MKGDLLRLSEKRRSVRRFQSERIPLEDIVYLLKTARAAPSGANRQPWRFLIIVSEKKKEIIRKICEESEKHCHSKIKGWFKEWLEERGINWRKPFLTESPILILVFGKRDEPYWLQSVWIAVGYLILAAEELGYGTLTYTPPNLRWANKLFEIPENYILQTIIPIGRPAEKPSHPGRMNLRKLAYIEEWGEPLSGL